MGNWLVQKYHALGKQYKLAFFATFCMGLLVHMYMFTNKLPNHDYVYNIHTDQFLWPLSLGRWFLNVVTGLSSYFSLPWVNGVLTIFYLAVAAGFLVAVLELSNAVPVLLCCGLLVSYPALTDTIGYMFTVDGYMFGFLLSVMAVWFWEKKSVPGFMAYAICLALTVAIYQSYLSVSVYLILIRLILDIFEQKYGNRELLKKGGIALAGGALGMILYYAGLMIMMKYHNVDFAGYMGIDQAAVPGIGTLAATLGRDTMAFIELFVGGNSDFTAYELLNILFMLALLAAYLMIGIKTGLYRKKLQTVLLIAASLLFIPTAYLWNFISQDVIYRFLMLYCVVLLYMLLIKLTDQYLTGWFSNAVMVLTMGIVLNFTLIDNIAYYNLELCWEQTYATAVRMEERITSLEDYDPKAPLFVSGTIRTEEREWLQERIPYMIGTNDVNLMRNQTFVVKIIEVDLGHTYDQAGGGNKESVIDTPQFQNMGCWPEADSVQMINGVIVVKLSEE